jgi:signal transduction histidine kinase
VGEGEAAESAPADFFSTAVHELRTPLTSVLGQAQLALRYVERDPARARAAITRTIEQASRMNRLIGELLDPSRVTVGALSLAVVSFDLGNTIAIAIPQYEHGDLPRISFEVPSEPVQVRGDPDRIAQVVGNLLDNALKYSPAGSPIAVSLAIVGNEAYVRVEDKGVGIAAEEGDRIFAPFYRAARTRDVPGTGLGLHISRRLAEQHRGRLWLEKSTDLGSVFTLALPFAESVPLAPGSEHEAEHEAEHEVLASQLARLETVADAISGEALPLETLRSELDRAYDLLAEKVLPRIRKADDLESDLVRRTVTTSACLTPGTPRSSPRP